MKVREQRKTDPPPARWWKEEPNGRLLCTLCPRFCRLGEGQAGFCYIRQNRSGSLVTLGFGRPTGFAVDPIEKKPLNHFLPGSPVLSFGTAGCNLGCKFCQNWTTSKARIDNRGPTFIPPDQVVRLALDQGCPSIAYTYNDPVVFAEYVVEIARLARTAGLRNVIVTAGYVTAGAREELFRDIDAANVDLKAFSERFYRKFSAARLDPVLDTLRWLHRESSVWLELTTLLIPGLNDHPEEIRQEADWIVDNLGPRVPLHFTAFHPDFRLTDRPPTPPETLRRARRIALAAGIEFVYLGNVHDEEGQTTKCPKCGITLIERNWHQIRCIRIEKGRCPRCSEPIPGLFDAGSIGSRSGTAADR